MTTSKSSAAWCKRMFRILFFILLPVYAGAQAAPDSSTIVSGGDMSDVRSIDAIVNALYDVISGEAGPRNWDRLRNLCLPKAQFNALVPGRPGGPRFHSGGLESYIKGSSAYFMKEAFYEKEIHRITEEYGRIAHVFSTYETRKSKNGEVTERGINSIQLVYDSGRWWVVNIMWSSETKDAPLPAKYLGK
jgi:hypothetical protein